MELTQTTVKRGEENLTAYYSSWHTQCLRWLKYFRDTYDNVKVPQHLKGVFPPIARRVVLGLAQQIQVDHRRVHCDPAENAQGRETTDAQERSSNRENAHRAAFAQDDLYALRQRRYPPGHGAVLEMLLFGLSAEIVLPNELALGPEPERRAGEALVTFERRSRLWEIRRLHQPMLPAHLVGILNLLIDPSGEWFLWKATLPAERARALLKRWSSNHSIQPNVTTVSWWEAYSDESRLVFCENELVHEAEGYGFLPLATALPVKGEPAIYSDSGTTGGPEHQYAGILSGCESILDDIARKESQLANFISLRVWPKIYPRGDNIPPDFQIDQDPTSTRALPPGTDFVTHPVPELPQDIWEALTHANNYIDSITQIDAMQGYRKAESGYQEAILSGLAGGVLKPYIDGLNASETQVAELRNFYAYVSDLFPDGIDLAATIGGKRIRGTLKRDDMDSLQVKVTHEGRLPQQRQTEWAFHRDVYEAGAGDMRTLRELGAGFEDPEAIGDQRRYEDWEQSEPVQQVLQRRIAWEVDEDLAREIEEAQAEGTQRLAGAIQQQAGPGMGPGLAPPGAGMGPAPMPVMGQPRAAAMPETEADLLIRQAQRRRVPAGRR